jgi:putative endonuclease
VTKAIGDAAEVLARLYLEQQGLVWICGNYRCPSGEIDLIMRDQQTLVFVEVRYRNKAGYGSSIETISRHKQRRLIKAAWHYLMEKQAVDKINARFDVLGISADEKFDWIPNAFEVQY